MDPGECTAKPTLRLRLSPRWGLGAQLSRSCSQARRPPPWLSEAGDRAHLQELLHAQQPPSPLTARQRRCLPGPQARLCDVTSRLNVPEWQLARASAAPGASARAVLALRSRQPAESNSCVHGMVGRLGGSPPGGLLPAQLVALAPGALAAPLTRPSYSTQPPPQWWMRRRPENRRETLFPAVCIKACPKWSPDLTSHFPQGLQVQRDPGEATNTSSPGPGLRGGDHIDTPWACSAPIPLLACLAPPWGLTWPHSPSFPRDDYSGLHWWLLLPVPRGGLGVGQQNLAALAPASTQTSPHTHTAAAGVTWPFQKFVAHCPQRSGTGP